MMEFLQSLDKDKQEGTVWRFEGTFRNYQFKGTVTMAKMVFCKGRT